MWKVIRNAYKIVNAVGNMWQVYTVIVGAPTAIVVGWGILKHQPFDMLIIEGLLTIIAFSLVGILYLGWRETNKPTIREASKSWKPTIDMICRSGAPYEVSEPSHGRVKNTVNIGLKNSGHATAANCRVSIDDISPPPKGLSFPIVLRRDFKLRDDDPEELIEVASHWDHLDGRFRFSSPDYTGSFSEAQGWIEDQPKRTIKLSVKATEYQRSAAFEISTDNDKRLHLKFIGYID